MSPLAFNNGFVICFGHTLKNTTTTLPITFQNTVTYSLLVTVNYTSNDMCSYSMNVGSKTVSSFQVTTQSNPGGNYCYYCAIGI